MIIRRTWGHEKTIAIYLFINKLYRFKEKMKHYVEEAEAPHSIKINVVLIDLRVSG